MSDLYSLIQFYPKALRREGVNVGVVVLSERLHAVRVKMSANNDLIREYHGAAACDDAWLSSAKRSLARRLEALEPTQAALLELLAKEAGQLLVLPPRPVAVEDLDRTVDLLFDELVAHEVVEQIETPTLSEQRERAPKLDEAFRPLVAQRLVAKVPRLTVPVLGKQIRGAYKYQNGALNYVKPQAFPKGEEAALSTAGNLGLLGHMLSKHPVHVHQEEVQQRLILVAQITQQVVAERIKLVLRDCSVRLILTSEMPGFLDEVRENAHALLQ